MIGGQPDRLSGVMQGMNTAPFLWWGASGPARIETG